MDIVDRRKEKSTRNATNKKRYIEKAKRKFLEKISKDLLDRPMDTATDGREYTVDDDSSGYGYSSDSPRDMILSGNSEYQLGDMIPRPEEGGQGGAGQGGGEKTVYLSSEEVKDILFKGWRLPDLIKKGGDDIFKLVYKRAGFTKEAPPPRLDLLQTMKKSIARRMAAKSESTPWLDDHDLVFRNFVNKKVPVMSATIIYLMDKSGSMGKEGIDTSRLAFTIMHMFLKEHYDTVKVHFVKYNETADEVTEEEFFEKSFGGGTEVRNAVNKVRSIIDSTYNPATTNIYVFHSGDGDYNSWGEKESLALAVKELLPMLTRYIYLEVLDDGRFRQFLKPSYHSLFHFFKDMRSRVFSVCSTKSAPAFRLSGILAELSSIFRPVDGG